MKTKQEERSKNFLSTDWLPLEKTRQYPEHVYTEPSWKRTIKGTLINRKGALEGFYDIFTIYKENGRVVAEGNLHGISETVAEVIIVPKLIHICSEKKVSLSAIGMFFERAIILYFR